MVQRLLLPLLALAALGLAARPTEAAVLKCKAQDGSITYTQTSCPPGTTNADFSEGSDPNRSANPDSSSAPAGTLSSARAMMFRDSVVGCTHNEKSDSCQMVEETVIYCTPTQNWDSEICVALREGMQAARDQINLSDGYSQHRLRQLCAQGRKLACTLNDCPADIFVKGSDEKVRACAARAELPVSGTWIKLESKRSGSGASSFGVTSKYVCLKKLERLNEIGEILSYRETVTVISFAPHGAGAKMEHTVSSLPSEKFATSDAAATAACEAKTAKPLLPQPRVKNLPQGA